MGLANTIQAGNSMRRHEENSCVATVSYDEKAFFRRTKSVSEGLTLDFCSSSGSMYVMSDIHEIKKGLVRATKTLGDLDKSLGVIGSAISN